MPKASAGWNSAISYKLRLTLSHFILSVNTNGRPSSAGRPPVLLVVALRKLAPLMRLHKAERYLPPAHGRQHLQAIGVVEARQVHVATHLLAGL
jgi:hypothetical protein